MPNFIRSSALALLCLATLRAAEPWDQPEMTTSDKRIKAHETYVARARQGGIGLLFTGDWIFNDFTDLAPKAIFHKAFDQYQPVAFATGGDTAQNALWRLMNGELNGTDYVPKVVVLQIGSVDGTNHHTAEQTFQGIQAMVTYIRKTVPTAKVLVLKVLPGGSEQSQIVNPLLARLDDTGEPGGDMVRVLDLAELFLDTDGHKRAELFQTGRFSTHLTPAGYQALADGLAEPIKNMFGK